MKKIISIALFATLLLFANDSFEGSLKADLDNDGKLESVKWVEFANDEYTTFYQLLVIDSGKIVWRGPKIKSLDKPLVFVASDFGISLPLLVLDVDGDKKVELISSPPQSDVSVTYFKRARWIGNKFKALAPRALVFDKKSKIFKWVKNSKEEIIWISDLKQPKVGTKLVKATIYNNEKNRTEVAEALIKFNKKGASIFKWIKPFKHSF